MRTHLKRIVSIVLLAVFVLYNIPKEIYHGWTHHNDTTHQRFGIKGKLHLSNQHHHCELLKIDQQFVSTDVHIPVYNFSNHLVYFIRYSLHAYHALLERTLYSAKQLRAPPSLLV